MKKFLSNIAAFIASMFRWNGGVAGAPPISGGFDGDSADDDSFDPWANDGGSFGAPLSRFSDPYQPNLAHPSTPQEMAEATALTSLGLAAIQYSSQGRDFNRNRVIRLTKARRKCDLVIDPQGRCFLRDVFGSIEETAPHDVGHNAEAQMR